MTCPACVNEESKGTLVSSSDPHHPFYDWCDKHLQRALEEYIFSCSKVGEVELALDGKAYMFPLNKLMLNYIQGEIQRRKHNT